MTVGPEIARALERAEIESWRDLFAAAPTHVRETLGLAERDFGSAFALGVRAVPSVLFNRVIGLGLFSPAGESDVDAIVAHFTECGVQFALNLSPQAEPAGLPAQLAGRGFATFFHHVKWIREAAPAERPASDLVVERVSPERAVAFATVIADVVANGMPARRDWMAACVGRPGWRHYLTLADGEPVGGAAMYVHGDVAWLGWGATRPERRGRGSQSLLLAARIDDARTAGCRWLTTETAPNRADLNPVSWRNAQRAGFEVAYHRPSWIRPG